MIANIQAGVILAGKYRVERVLGRGGMGVVVAAIHLQLDEMVALKFLLPEALKSADALARFEREARAAVKIKSEHVARVIDVGRLDDGAPYIVMEYLQGADLRAILAQRGPLPLSESVDLLLQACEAVAEAHVLGIVHRDLKPANLFLAHVPNGPPIVKVLDFGISKSVPARGEAHLTRTNLSLGRGAPTLEAPDFALSGSVLAASEGQLTQTSALLGSPMYMSPEQMQSARLVDVRSDIWALGIVLYEMLAGCVPFRRPTVPELIAAVLQREPEPLRGIRHDLPPDLEAIVARCLQKAPAARFGNVGELAISLVAFGSPRSVQSLERIQHVLGQSSPGQATHPDAPVPPATALRPGTLAHTTSRPVHGDLPRAPKASATRGLPGGLLGAVLAAMAALAAAWVFARWGPPVPTTSRPGTDPSFQPPASQPPFEASTPPDVVEAGAADVGTPDARRPSPPPSPPPLKNCKPPFTLDSAGHHIYKPECT